MSSTESKNKTKIFSGDPKHFNQSWDKFINDKTKYTCYHCERKYSCWYAWDEYNKNGDCLADK